MKIIERIHDIETGKIQDIERDETPAEIALRTELEKNLVAEQTAEANKATAKAALLAQLGITEEQAKLLLN